MREKVRQGRGTPFLLRRRRGGVWGSAVQEPPEPCAPSSLGHLRRHSGGCFTGATLAWGVPRGARVGGAGTSPSHIPSSLRLLRRHLRSHHAGRARHPTRLGPGLGSGGEGTCSRTAAVKVLAARRVGERGKGLFASVSWSNRSRPVCRVSSARAQLLRGRRAYNLCVVATRAWRRLDARKVRAARRVSAMLRCRANSVTRAGLLGCVRGGFASSSVFRRWRCRCPRRSGLRAGVASRRELPSRAPSLSASWRAESSGKRLAGVERAALAVAP